MARGASVELKIGGCGTHRMLRGPLEPRRTLVARAADVGLDHLFVADHISFFVGAGMDGLINAASLLAMDARINVVLGVYLLALRHPMAVARQIATIAEGAPGRLVFGVGVGGEDRHEFEVCGVDPATRGRRTDESLAVLRPLLRGDRVTHAGEFFAFDDGWIQPAPDPAIPILVGGRSDAALRRAGRFSEGWLGVWCSARRFGDAVNEVDGHAKDAGREDTEMCHGLQIWAGVDSDRNRARERLGRAMSDLYRIPFERFERYSPYGSAEEIAAFLAPYAEAGARRFNVMCVADSEERSIDTVADVRERLRAHFA